MESTLSIQRIGNYSTKQINDPVGACKICKEADWADVIINGICGKCLLHHFETIGETNIEYLQKELSLYKQALTKAISLPKGILPHTKDWYTWMNNGNCVIEKRPNKSMD